VIEESTAPDSLALATERRETICSIFGEVYDPERWNDWRWQMRRRLIRPEHFRQLLKLTSSERRGLKLAQEKFSVAVTPHFAELMDPDDPRCPIRMQVVPREEEMVVSRGDMVDPCGEDHHSPVPGLVHRYPDRVLLLALDTCASYCRYCTRSRLVSQGELEPLPRRVDAIIEYLAEHSEVRDVLLSGGDPLILSDDRLGWLLAQLRAIPHIELVRIGTKVPAVLPQRVTPHLCRMLRKHHPLFMSLHFIHPDELTPEAERACGRLADAGIPLGGQSVLLKGVNDDAATMKALVNGMLRMRVRPYYLHQCDAIAGSAPFRTSVAAGRELIRSLHGHTSGYAVPMYMIDAPGGGGKVPAGPDYVAGREGDDLLLRNYAGDIYRYRDPA
jgi:lysine 2,3-aminomutase